MLVLGIETSCDETACAVVSEGRTVLSNVIYSQSQLHSAYGGVFPELACRKHVDAIIPAIEAALQQAGVCPQEIDLIAVASGPGLIGALLIGVNAAKALAMAWDIPFIGVNHVEAHLYGALMSSETCPMPALGIVISGGHTFMVKMPQIGTYEPIGTTQDDAVGEAFDKVASMLQLPYPGGPSIEQLAKKGNPSDFTFNPGKVKGRPWDFSFSGLKTSVLYAVKGSNASKDAPLLISEEKKANVAAAFQETALRDITTKSLNAARAFGCRAIVCGGGVSNNARLKELFNEKNSDQIPLFFPHPTLTTDNAAMIAGLGTHRYIQRQQGDSYDLEPHCSRRSLI